MQTVSAITPTVLRPATGSVPEIMPTAAVTAIREPKASSPESSTVILSEAAKDRYVSDQNKPVKNEESESPLQQAGQKAAEKAAGSESTGGSDAIAGTLERLKELLKEAQQRLRVAQQQMAQAMAEMKNAGTESQKMTAMLKVQAAQTLVISAQGEVLEIHAQINKILQEQQKQAKGGSGG